MLISAGKQKKAGRAWREVGSATLDKHVPKASLRLSGKRIPGSAGVASGAEPHPGPGGCLRRSEGISFAVGWEPSVDFVQERCDLRSF